jgi:NDP-sugar pyrophosphorylase family protein
MTAVILAGGLGMRLRPFTSIIPKPILPVGESSVLEIQILSLSRQGFRKIIIATNYLSDLVAAYLGDGSRFGVELEFSREAKPLGTCGPLSLVRQRLTEPFVLMNGDVLTTMNFQTAYDFALALPADLTIVTTQIATPFAFGKVLASGDYITDLQEKPDIRFEILSGIYILKPAVLSSIPDNQYYNIDELIRSLINSGRPVGRYRMTGYWLDIGTTDHYEMAQAAYSEHFSGLKQPV